jgi:hypothetical protein
LSHRQGQASKGGTQLPQQIFYLTVPQLILLCEHYSGSPIDRDRLRDSACRENILKLEKYNYLKILDSIFLDAKITETGKKRVQMALKGDQSGIE